MLYLNDEKVVDMKKKFHKEIYAQKRVNMKSMIICGYFKFCAYFLIYLPSILGKYIWF